MIRLFILTMTLLLLPKLLGFCAGIFRREIHHGQGRIRLVASAVMELLFSILHAPIVMLLHSRHLWEIIRGQDSGWSAQQRRGRMVPWTELLRRHGGHTAVGLLATAQLVWLGSPLLYWMLPMVVGLILAIPLSALSGSCRVASLLARAGLLHTPEECKPPAIMKRRDAFQDHFEDAVNAAGLAPQPLTAGLPAPDRPTDI